MSSDLLKFTNDYSFYIGCTLFTLGNIGNCINILILTQIKHFRYNQCGFYLIIETFASFFYQIILFSLNILTIIYGDDATSRNLIWCRFRYVLGQICAITVFYMICFAAIDQFFSTHYRINLRQICTLKIARYVTSIFFVICISHSIMFSFFMDANSSQICVILNPIFLGYATYFFYPVLTGLFPLVTASCFGLLAFRNVRRIIRRQIPLERRRLDRQMTAMVLTRIIIFTCSVSPYISYRIYAINYPLSRSRPTEYAIGRLIQAIFLSFVTINYTISFYAYVFFISRFRRQMKYVLKKKCWHRCKSCFTNRIIPENVESIDTNAELNEND